MKIWKIAFIAAAIASLGSIAGAQIANGGFESGSISPWFQFDSGDPADNWGISLDAHTGQFAASVAANNSIRQDFSPIVVTSISQFSFWMRNTDMQESAINIRYSDSTLTPFIARFTYVGWTFFDITPFLSVSKSVSGIEFSGHLQAPNPNRTYLDDVQINVVPEPASVLVLSFLSAAIVCRKCKGLRASGDF